MILNSVNCFITRYLMIPKLSVILPSWIQTLRAERNIKWKKVQEGCFNYAIFNSQHFLNAICSMQLIWRQFILMKHFNSILLCNKRLVVKSTTLIKTKFLVVVWRKLYWVAPSNWEGFWCFFSPYAEIETTCHG